MSDSGRPVPVKGLRGRVVRSEYAKGSKSERTAVFIESGEGRYLLRRKSGPAVADPGLERFVGRTVTCDGFLLGTTFLAEKIAAED
jgi:hypothetical protein